MSNFYPRSPCGERHRYDFATWMRTAISIHALLAESDLTLKSMTGQTLIFLSTLSLRRATEIPSECCSGTSNFYPRSPCGERPDDLGDRLANYCISIHALLAESDQLYNFHITLFRHFYPRSPCGERPANPLPITSPTTFLSTLSLRRATSRIF